MALFREKVVALKNGQSLILRPVQMFEAAHLLEVMYEIAQSSPHILSTPESFKRITQEQEESWIQRHNSEEGSLLIAADDRGKIVGLLDFQTYKDDKRNHRGALGISIHLNYRGLGLGQSMFQLLFDHLKSLEHLRFIELSVMSENTAAIELYKKIGFREISRWPEAFRVDGRWTDEVFMRKENKP